MLVDLKTSIIIIIIDIILGKDYFKNVAGVKNNGVNSAQLLYKH